MEPVCQGNVLLQGLDSTGVNYGGNIFRDYTTRIKDDGFAVGSGNKALFQWRAQCIFMNSGRISSLKYTDAVPEIHADGMSKEDSQSLLLSAGIRWNIFRRTYDF